MRYIIVAGEVLYPSTVMLCRKMAPNAHLCSGYGPTEASVRFCSGAKSDSRCIMLVLDMVASCSGQ